MPLEGESSRGIFYTAGGGRNYRRRPRKGGDALARFAEALSHHVDKDDLAAGRNLATGASLDRGQKLDPGGNPRVAAQRVGLKPESGNGMLQRLRKRLGDQAR